MLIKITKNEVNYQYRIGDRDFMIFVIAHHLLE